MSELVAEMTLDDKFFIHYKEPDTKKERPLSFKMKLKCRCCDVRIPDRIITCGYCGESVNQLDCRTQYGKWFHSECFTDFRNFYKHIFTINRIKNRKDLQVFRDHILTEMIMRHDLRLLKQQWSLLVYNKAVPLVISQQYVGSGMRK